MSNELAKSDNAIVARNQPIGMGIVPSTIEEAQTIANALYKTGVFNADNAAHAFAKVIIGADFGFSATFSLMNIYVYKNNIGMEYPAMAAVLKRSGYSYRVIEQSATKCAIQFLNRDGTEPGPPVIWTADDSKKAGTQNMDKYPQAMLFARAMATGCRMYCSDAFAGAVYSKDEIEEIRQNEPPAPNASDTKGIAALSAKIQNGESAPSIDPMAESREITLTREEFYDSLNLTADERRDFESVCQGDQRDIDDVIGAARNDGITDGAALFAFVEGQRGLFGA